ncbi:queuine/other tRNA-ribosyltransferase [Mycobacterium sp. Root135]|uniref:tRNA-guanine transglycosylase DpdA n=1 Tax=Mycobacterium sp. Root135 TaxID=1736457 RepID=UPI0006FD8C9E|nr:tRNA-guanine transglycosylase DpdA [Mycobacterium sp. Root135]KQY07978.1 queuine/other tRNA-ribosyltransferase [Mycobacterium sp. Root135]
MKFYFPDSQDQVSPTYDFVHDEHSPLRVRQRDDKYAHEVLTVPAYNGILVSKAIVDGSIKGVGKYSMPQRQRLYRLGVRGFFRLPSDVQTLGDCGAFNYVNEPEPPYNVNEVLDFYEQCGFDAGVSIDHIILGFRRDLSDAPDEWKERRRISLSLAEKCKAAADERGTTLRLYGAAQGWDPASYADSVRQLQDMGYDHIALGGMVPLKTTDILACLLTIDRIRLPSTRLHLLGITRIDAMAEFETLGVRSFDSTSSFRQSFMDDRDNYHSLERTYAAIKVPQVDGNVSLKRAILSGRVSQRAAIDGERMSLQALRAFDRGDASLDETLDAVIAYESIVGTKKSYREQYAETLRASPWKRCGCGLCEKHGIEMIIFRASERNKRRGFHNLSVLAEKMKRLRPSKTALLERTSSG